MSLLAENLLAIERLIAGYCFAVDECGTDCQVYAIDAEPGPYLLSQGIHDDRLRKEAGRWVFEERRHAADSL